MKAHHLIAPILALAGSAYWLNQQKVTIHSLTEKKQVITERLAIVAKAISDNPVKLGGSPTNTQDDFALPDGSLDWEKIAAMMAESRGAGGMPTNIKAMLKLQQKLMELTEDEIVKGLAKINTLDLAPEAVEQLRQSLLNQLSEKNPLAALAALGDPVGSNSNSRFWTQRHILSKVAKENPAAAIAWVDKQIADGKLRSTSLDRHANPRLQLEASLINQLLTSDFPTAKSRLEAFNEEEIIHILTSTDLNQNKEAGQNLIKLARESLPPEQASRTIIQAWRNAYHDDLAKISESIQNVPFSETERTEVIEGMVNNYSRNNNTESKFTEIYEWSQKESPGQETALLSKALANERSTWKDPQKSFEKALSLSDSLGDPAIATGFVELLNKRRKQDTFLSEFQDPKLAEKFRAMISALPQETSDSE